jgi:hypothetical protein
VLGADFEALRQAVRRFQGVEHRLEFVQEFRGVQFYNDSKATSVDAAAKALSAFDRGVHLILGGKDKGAPYAPLVPLLKDRVRCAYLIGAAAERIARELRGAAEIDHAGDLETAVRRAFDWAAPGEVILLSPACSSFDQFQDYEHRGRVFKELVSHLAREAATTELEARKRAAMARLAPHVFAAPPVGRLAAEPVAEGAADIEAPLLEHIIEALPAAQPEATTTELPAPESGFPQEKAIPGSIGSSAAEGVEESAAQPEKVAAGAVSGLASDEPPSAEILASEPLSAEPSAEAIEEGMDQTSATQPNSSQPVAEARGQVPPPLPVKYPELLYVYEVGAEETAAPEMDSSPAPTDVEADSCVSVDADAPERVDDEALPFEVRVGAAPGTHGSSKSTASAPRGGGELDGKTPGKPRDGQGRLPGI